MNYLGSENLPMDTNVAIMILLGLFFILLIIRVPITFALIISSLATGLYMKFDFSYVLMNMVEGVNNFSLLAIPFFILMGEIMGAGGISRRIVDFACVLVGRIRGGLGMVNVIASMFFGGISGSAVADVSSIGSIIVPMMDRKKYDRDFSVPLTVAGACQGIIIPPSHNMIIFSFAVGGVSIGRLFLGGYIPGILLGVSLMIMALFISAKRKYPKEEKIPLKKAFKITLDALSGLFTAVIVVVGVITGIFTATESAAFACLYAFILTFFVYKEIPLRAMNKIIINSLKTLAIVMSLIIAASAFSKFLALLRVPDLATEFLLNVTDNKILLLLLINVLLLLLGCIMDMTPLILICAPILYPVVVTNLGMDPVQFGVMLLLNLGIGLCTPPVGSALFVGCTVGKISIEKATKGLLPFYGAMIVTLLLVTFLPEFTMFLPDKFMPK
jgi:tripartite ATP-independent transporter DctM subunit